MGYCLSCGKLRDLNGAFCRQCALDFDVRRKKEAEADKRRIMRNIARDKRGDSDGKSQTSKRS